MACGPAGSCAASSALRRLVSSSSSSCRSSGVVGIGLEASGYGAQEGGLRALATKAVRRKDGGAIPPDAAVVTVPAAAKKRVYKGRNLFEVAQFLPGWGVGAKMAKKHWRADTFYEITDIKLNKDSRHGSAWGVFHDAGIAAEKAQRIGGVHKREWRYLKDVPERVWKTLPDAKGQARCCLIGIHRLPGSRPSQGDAVGGKHVLILKESMAPQDAACRMAAAALLVLLLLTTAVDASNGRRAVLQRSAEAYATLLYGDEFVLGARVLGKSLRDVGARKDMVVLVSQGVSEESVETLSADGWIVERISLLENPNAEDKRPARFWGVYTKLYVFNMTQYKKVVYLDADTIVVQPIEELFQCSSFCANLKHSERLNSGVMVVEPSTALFEDMLAKVTQLYSYTGGDQGFLNSYYADFPNAKLFDPKLSAEAREAGPRPDMERLSTYYNGDVGLYVMGNKWMFDERELKVLHYTLGPLKPWDWWTAWLLKPVDQWHKIRLSLEESVPGVGGGSTYRNGLIVIVLTYLPIFLLAVGYRKLLLQALRGMCNGAWLGFCRQLWHKCCSGSSPIYSSLSVSPPHGISAGVSGSGNNRLPPFLVFWSVCACFAIALLSLGFAFVIVPFQVTPWTGMILVYEWTFFSFLVMFGTYLEAIYLLGRRTGASMASSSSELSHDKSFSKGRGGKEDPAFWDLETALYELGMAGLAILIPALPHICDVTAILPRVALMVAAGMLLVSFITHAAGHLAIRWFILGRDDWGRTRGVSLCCGIV